MWFLFGIVYFCVINLESLWNISETIPRGGCYQANLFHSIISPIFQHCENIVYVLNITFIFVRCHCSLTLQLNCGDNGQISMWFKESNKYFIKYFTSTALLKMSLMNEFMRRVLVTFTPGHYLNWWQSSHHLFDKTYTCYIKSSIVHMPFN